MMTSSSDGLDFLLALGGLFVLFVLFVFVVFGATAVAGFKAGRGSKVARVVFSCLIISELLLTGWLRIIYGLGCVAFGAMFFAMGRSERSRKPGHSS